MELNNKNDTIVLDSMNLSEQHHMENERRLSPATNASSLGGEHFSYTETNNGGDSDTSRSQKYKNESLLEASRMDTIRRQEIEIEKLKNEVKEGYTERASMEYLLREKVEELLQNEIEEKLKFCESDPSNARTLLLEQKTKYLEGELEKWRNQSEDKGKIPSLQQSDEKQAAELESIRQESHLLKEALEREQEQNVTLIKERSAVKTILEEKVQVLLKNINGTSASLLTHLPDSGGQPGQVLKSQMSAMERLISAFITALSNNVTAKDGKTSTPLQNPLSNSTSFNRPLNSKSPFQSISSGDFSGPSTVQTPAMSSPERGSGTQSAIPKFH